MGDAVSFKESSIVNPRKQSLYTVQYLPAPGTAKANLVWAHGLGEHVGRYTKVFTKLAQAGIAVHSFDAMAHGKSDPKGKKDRAVIWRFKDLVDDLYFVSGHLTKASGTAGLPTFLGGQSMGGLIAAHAVLRDQAKWAGLILHSAAINVEWTPVLRMQAPIGGLLGHLMPRARIVPAVRPADMSQDPKVVQDYVQDPLNTVGNVAARTGAVILRAFNTLKPKYREFVLPLYAAHGTLDKCTSLPAVRRLLAGASSEDKELNEVQGGYHELLKGPEADECTSRINQWINSRLSPRSRL